LPNFTSEGDGDDDDDEAAAIRRKMNLRMLVASLFLFEEKRLKAMSHVAS
jgi:hypothetical protein